MTKVKTRYIDINVKKGSFVTRFIGSKKNPHDFSDIMLLRKLLSNEKARILYILKAQKPKSIYQLAKIIGRDFKSVRDDVKLLEKFGFIEFQEAKTGKRESLMPVLIVDKMNLVVNI
jgi:predicted transcriptional regulator